MTMEIEGRLETMSERLEKEITEAVGTILAKSGYFRSDSIVELVKPVAAWACGLPYEAHEKGFVITD